MPEDTARRIVQRMWDEVIAEHPTDPQMFNDSRFSFRVREWMTGAAEIIGPSSAHQLIEDGRLIAEWLGRAVNGPGSHHPFANYRLPGPIEQAMKRLTGSHDEQIGDSDA